MGRLALPPMMRLKYDKRLATGAIAAGGTLGILIPPSVLLILYAANAGESIVRLYLGAFVPGFLLSATYVILILIFALLSAVYRKLNWNVLKPAVFQAARTSSIVLTLLVGSSIFSSVFARLGGSKVIETFVLGLGLSPGQYIWLMMIA